MKRSQLNADPERVREWQQRSRASVTRKRRPISPASKAQREKVGGRSCLVCGSAEATTPAHIVDRSLGGCDDALCVVPLRVDYHHAYDAHELDLLPYLEAHGLRDEIAHAVGHLGLIGALERITGEKWAPVGMREAA